MISNKKFPEPPLPPAAFPCPLAPEAPNPKFKNLIGFQVEFI